jgi:polar amino acid transport system substrate-binding protein
MSRRFVPLPSVLAALALAATVGCQSVGSPGAPATAEQPTTPSAAAPPSGQAPVAPTCNPRASLRPQGPLPAPGHMPAGMVRIAQRGYLIAGVDRDVNLIAVRNKNLEWEGFDIDVARDIAEAIFGDRQKVQFRPLPEAERVPAVELGVVDLSVATITIACDRRAHAEFSAVYFEAAQRVLVNRGSGIRSLADLGGKRVCAARGSTSLDRLRQAPSKPIPVDVSSTTDCLAWLQLGKVDAVSTDDVILAGMAAQDPKSEVVGPGFSEEPYGVAVSRGNPDLVRFVNAVLERRAQDGRWQASYQRWLAAPLHSSSAPPTPQYRDSP